MCGGGSFLWQVARQRPGPGSRQQAAIGDRQGRETAVRFLSQSSLFDKRAAFLHFTLCGGDGEPRHTRAGGRQPGCTNQRKEQDPYIDRDCLRGTKGKVEMEKRQSQSPTPFAKAWEEVAKIRESPQTRGTVRRVVAEEMRAYNNLKRALHKLGERVTVTDKASEAGKGSRPGGSNGRELLPKKTLFCS